MPSDIQRYTGSDILTCSYRIRKKLQELFVFGPNANAESEPKF